MVLGLAFRRIGWIDEAFASKLNQFVFRVPLPLLVFEDLATVDFSQIWNVKFVLFCFVATLLSILYVQGFPCFGRIGRSAVNLFRPLTAAARRFLGLHLSRIFMVRQGWAVDDHRKRTALQYDGCGGAVRVPAGTARLDKTVVKRTMTGIVTNPIILGIVAGFCGQRLGCRSLVSQERLSEISPVWRRPGADGHGRSFDIQKAVQKGRPAIVASVMKLVGFCVIFLPVAIAFGFREEELVAILVMLGSATTVSCYVMARNMGHEGVLTSSTVMLTTLFSAFTLTGWLFLLRSAGLI